jgi:predicted PurR-regulated permease PerM
VTNKQVLTVGEIRGLIVFGVLFTALVFLILRFIAAIIGIVILFSLVALIVIVLNPGVGWLERHKIPRPLSVGVMALLMLITISFGLWLVFPLAASQTRDLFSHLPTYLNNVQGWLTAKGGKIGAQIPSVNPNRISQMLSQGTGQILSRIGTYTLNAVSLVASAIVLFISVIYILANPKPIIEGLLNIVKADQRDFVTKLLQKIGLMMRQWALSLGVGMLAIFLLTWILLGLILHVPYSFLFAILAGLLEIVPTIGPILSAVPPTLVMLADKPIMALWIIIGFVVIQQIENNLIVPLVYGSGLKLHPVSVIFTVLVMGGLFGIIGIFLAVPTLAVIKTIFEELHPSQNGPKEKTDVSQKADQVISGDTKEEPE